MPRRASIDVELPAPAIPGRLSRAVPRMGLSAPEAALSVGIGETMFRAMVDDGRMPRPRVIGARRLWDVDELCAAFKSLPHEGETEVDTWADVGLGS